MTKDAVDRVRPAGPLVDTSESAFPSGHAAYATTWIAAGGGAHPRARPCRARRRSSPAAIVLTAAIGLSRVYLRAHYWSDVAGGWALGAGIFGLLATIALIVEYVRNNEPQHRRATPLMTDLTTTEITIALAIGLTVSCYAGLILMPAWRCYGRVWEKLAASFLTLFILAHAARDRHRDRPRGRLELRPIRLDGIGAHPAEPGASVGRGPGRRYDRVDVGLARTGERGRWTDR